ncbi:MAG: hypothetical protein HEEMFOPI_01886 [Holosporales bacterium]
MTNQNGIKFSIIIPTYNHAHLIKRCLDSLIAQTYQNWEAIIVNNFSSDNTIEIINSYNEPRFKLINYANRGIIAASRNEGIRQSTGDWVSFLDSDDWWHSEKLERVLVQTDASDLIYHDLKIISEGKGSNKFCRGRRLSHPVYFDLLTSWNCIANSSCSVRRSLLDLPTPLKEEPELVAVEDFDLWLRIAKKTERFTYISNTLGFYWQGNSNISAFSLKQLERLEAVYSAHADRLYGQNKSLALGALSYQKGFVFYKLKKYNSALCEFQSSFFNARAKIKLKALVRITQCAFLQFKEDNH